MTLLEAAALATFGARNRRLLRAILYHLTERSSTEGDDMLPPREPHESLIEWACRCRAPLVPPEQLQTDVTAAIGEGRRHLLQAESRGIVPLRLFDDRYPPLLGSIPDPPVLLWTRGDPAHLLRPAIAIVGSRAATPHGLEMARRLARDLSAAGLVVVSGLARGVDSAAHAATLAAGGATVAVLGCGADRIYPAEHAELAGNIVRAGTVVSEFPPGCPPRTHHFPLRNRIISGLSHAVVVVEAPEKSGALITAAAAAEQGREVMVVPGPVASGRNRGGHLLIRDGAKVVETGDDILQEVGRPIAWPTASGPDLEIGQLPNAVDFTVDELAEQTGEPPSLVLARLLELELSGQIQRIGGGRFVRCEGRVLP
jgi:DNA processing protein